MAAALAVSTAPGVLSLEDSAAVAGQVYELPVRQQPCADSETPSARIDEVLADEMFARFREVSHFEALFRSAIEACHVVVPDSPLILAIGAGTGTSTVAPLLRQFHGARIVATDCDAHKLAALQFHLRDSGASERVTCLLREPDADITTPQDFDLVAGAFVLHRLVDPDEAMARAFRALKPGGHAIFLEPFEGQQLLRLAFERIAAEAEIRREALYPRCARRWAPSWTTSARAPCPTPYARASPTWTRSGCSPESPWPPAPVRSASAASIS